MSQENYINIIKICMICAYAIIVRDKMRENVHFIPIDSISLGQHTESFKAISEQSHRIVNIEVVKKKEHNVLPVGTEYDFVAINTPSTYQQGMIPDGEEPPWGMLRVVAIARESYGFNAGVLDAHRLRMTPKEIADQIRISKAKLVGLNPTSVNVTEARIIADICVDQNVPYILGGIHATLDPRIAREDFPEAYAIVRGNGEVAIEEVLSAFLNGGKRSVNEGIYYFDQDTSEGSFYAKKVNPGEIPIVRQDWYVEEPIYTHNVEIGGKSQTIHESTLYVTDGCPFECTFCSSPVMVNRGKDIPYARPEIGRIIDEVEHVIDIGADAIHFLDDMAFIRGDNIRDFYNAVVERGLKGRFIWRGLTRAPVMLRSDFDEETMRMMKDSGVWKIALGIESGNDDLLKKIKKQVTKDQVREAVSKLNKYDIQVKGFFMFGFPGETERQMQDTLDFINELKGRGLTEIGAFQFKPYPGTQEYAELLRLDPDIISKLDYLRIKHFDLVGKAQDRADTHVWLDDNLKIADVPSGDVRQYVESALGSFYGDAFKNMAVDPTCI